MEEGMKDSVSSVSDIDEVGRGAVEVLLSEV